MLKKKICWQYFGLCLQEMLKSHHFKLGLRKGLRHEGELTWGHYTRAVLSNLVSNMVYSTRHMKVDKSESLKNCGTDISRSSICLAKFARHFDLCWWYLVPEAEEYSTRGLVSSDTRDAPREAFLARFASSDTREALSIFTCRVL